MFVDSAIHFLQEREKTSPFFLYVALMAPHDPRVMPERFLNMYDPDKIKLPENFQPEHTIDTGSLRNRDETLAEFPRDPAEVRRHIAEYYAMISHLDDSFARLIESLRETGQYENTIIVFAGDNGLAVGQHGLMGKQNLYEHSVRVPLILSGPGVPQGEQRDALVYLLDIFPTLCQLTNQEAPASVEGQSLVPCLNASECSGREILYLAYATHIRGVTDGRYKLIEYICGTTQLFDVANDPKEMTNLAETDPSNPIIAKMRKQLVQLADQWDDMAHPKGKKFWEKRKDLRNG